MSTISFEVPTVKPSDAQEISTSPYIPHLYIPANKEIIEALEVDGVVDIKIKGLVKGLESRETASEDDRYEFQVEVKSVTVDPENEFTKLAEDD